ncbi:hypothetical protein H9M94_00655 [Mycoplasma sp. Pen4]|uniref:hypothetical protein n=1 Tax=Mycoplasma sp. Pen4 TaxID=640330 RepID=UPI001654BBB1|nr:hypothetical protein [Mycoplasma sp. Pen4]QNM93774.1 hypothetical protein H9M94_00655 [Mycoplasma sp. Pen4]
MKLKKYIQIWFFLFLATILSTIAGAIMLAIAKEKRVSDFSVLPEILGALFLVAAIGSLTTSIVFYLICIIESHKLEDNNHLVFILLIIGFFVPFVGFVAMMMGWVKAKNL